MTCQEGGAGGVCYWTERKIEPNIKSNRSVGQGGKERGKILKYLLKRVRKRKGVRGGIVR